MKERGGIVCERVGGRRLFFYFFNPDLFLSSLALSFSLPSPWSPDNHKQNKRQRQKNLQKKPTHRLIRSSAEPCRSSSSRSSPPPPLSARSLGGAARGAERFTPCSCCCCCVRVAVAVAVAAGAVAGTAPTLAGLAHTRTHPPASAVTSAPLLFPPPALPLAVAVVDAENATSESGSECAGAARATAGTKVISDEAGAGAIREVVGEGG